MILEIVPSYGASFLFCFYLSFHYLGEVNEHLSVERFRTFDIGMYSIVTEHLGIPVNVLIGTYSSVKIYVTVARISYPFVLLNVIYYGS